MIFKNTYHYSYIMGLDEQLYKLPFIGWIIKRLYSYFKKHIAFTDAIHISGGLGLGLLLTEYKALGIVLILISILGHIYAFAKGK